MPDAHLLPGVGVAHRPPVEEGPERPGCGDRPLAARATSRHTAQGEGRPIADRHDERAEAWPPDLLEPRVVENNRFHAVESGV